MSSKDTEGLEAKSIAALNAYCRVMEIHISSIAQGTPPLTSGPGAKAFAMAVESAAVALEREVEFLRFLRERGKESPGDQ